ncbi:MAG TPA: diguanylate cyclase [Ideonella sp.]|nr:diguanylate cyclase [Ideonella sp.]
MTLFEHSTLRLNKGETSLPQPPGDLAYGGACLVLYSGEDTGKRYALDQARAVIGRTPRAEVYIESPAISRRHAELEVAGDSVTLRDLGSVNGTCVNEVRVEAPVLLQDGDLIRMGEVVLKFFRRASLDALLHDRMYRMATIDAGTDVFCKRYLLQALEREVRLAHRYGRPLSLVCLDLDHFKAVNDRYGHNAGDVVLRDAAAAVQAVVRASDVFGRIGGEEFAAVLPNTALAQAVVLAERFRAVVEQAVFELPAGEPPERRTLRHRQTASLGVAQLGREMQDGRCLLGAADEMLYAAKRGGRNRVEA